MNITIRPMNFNDNADCQLVFKWDTDPEITHLIYPFKNKKDKYPHPDSQSLFKYLKKKCHLEKKHYMIFDGEEAIGACGIIFNPDWLYKKVNQTAWLGVNIGDKSYWGKGVGLFVMEYLEQICLNQKFLRIEIGSFEFNKRAHKMFTKLGYKEIGKIQNFTFYKDKMWSDKRFEKILNI